MYKVLIHSKVQGEMWLAFNTEEEANSFVNQAVESGHYGKIARVEVIPAYDEVIPEHTLEDGSIVSEEVIHHEEVHIQHEGEVTFEFVDLTHEIEKENKLKQIAELESKITPRRLREAVLSGDHSFIQDIEAQIAAIRGTL